MALEEKLRFAGDVNIDEIRIIGAKGQHLDITGLVIEVQLFEDIFSPFITGKIILQDSLDLINRLPLIGQEFVLLNIRTPTFTEQNKIIRETFYLYKLTNREQVGDKAVMYELHFISPEAIYDVNTRFNRAFENINSRLVSIVFSSGFTTSKNIVINEETSNSTKFVACNWSPIRTINFLSKTSVSMSGNRSNYLFFENKYGFNHTTLNHLYEIMPVYQNFQLIAKTRDIDERTGKSAKNPELDYTKIIEFEMPTAFDYMDRALNGMFGSKIITHDYVTKKYGVKTFNVLDEFKKQPSLNPYPIFTNSLSRTANALVMVEPKHYEIHNGFSDITNTKHILNRISLRRLSEAFKFNITVAGRTDYTVGQVVTVKMPTFESHTNPNDPDVIDRMFTGKYLISALNHVIKTDRHETHMELIKDSLIFNLDA